MILVMMMMMLMLMMLMVWMEIPMLILMSRGIFRMRRMLLGAVRSAVSSGLAARIAG